jgi:2-polyprenyl-3-methyl-5-hydroxy-6-metoxy-1,4-benzoquinol methylase
MMDQEKQRLKSIKFSSLKGFNSKLIEFRYKTIAQFFKGKRCLELGCADGKGTEYLLPYFEEVVAVDGSEKLINILKERIKSRKLKAYVSLFEEFKPKFKFDTIILGHVLEHVLDPVLILRLSKKWLKKGGVILITVPNANSLHRQAGVLMGLLKKVTDLNESDIEIGHRRVYTIKTLMRDIKKAGLKIKKWGGIFLKPLSNKQIEESWSDDLINAYYELGKKYPEIAAELYVVCSK